MNKGERNPSPLNKCLSYRCGRAETTEPNHHHDQAGKRKQNYHQMKRESLDRTVFDGNM